jgi:hypothetical protein
MTVTASGSHETPRWREMDSNPRSPAGDGHLLEILRYELLIGLGILGGVGAERPPVGSVG